ncbi:MAG: 2-dehydropantoate 2-reductase [Magnetococcales bacterium]|nr:2-dehydropantoate 2-reductase [Magnetococcales bacterium]
MPNSPIDSVHPKADAPTLLPGGPHSPSILVVGMGAVGGYYGARLAQAGAKVSGVCRSDFDTIATYGIYIKSIAGDRHFRPEQLYRTPAQCPTPPDIVMVTLKSLPEIDLPAMIKPVVGPNTSIMLLQNGVEIEAPIAAAFPDNEIISALAFICVSREKPGHVHHEDYGRVAIGSFPSGHSQRVDELADLLNQAHVPCSVTDNIITARWKKLVWNAPFNPISVLAGGLNTQEILGEPELVQLAEKVMQEVCSIAAATGHPLEEDIVRRNLTDTKKMRAYRTSMLLDFEAGRKMEVEAILGNATRAAERLKVETPHMQTLYALLKGIVKPPRSATHPKADTP